MIAKLLIANRGEIACRIIRTAKNMGIQTVAVYSDADRQALHVLQADEAIYLGASPSKDSYLRGDYIIEQAKLLGVDAIHPGYGFLSENAAFAQACTLNDIIFVGPPASAIKAMGSKSAAKNIMENACVPLVPGYHGDDQTESTLKRVSDEMGYPVLLKAAAGGGGKGMRQVWNESDFHSALQAAKRESMASFGDAHMLVEKYLTQPRHIEIQVFCDTHGNGVYLFDRDCSIQRRHQKVIEEAPAPNISDEIRQQMGEAALQAAKAISYVGAGTVEFLLDEDGAFYFMEMNTRLQVEHPITEMVTGEDLVLWQLLVAEGKPLPKKQSELTLKGHAFEARIYAEDPQNDFLPATGTLSLIKTPTLTREIRIDTGVEQGNEISVYYDPMISKLIVWGENRDVALKRLISALSKYHIDGVVTNIAFLKQIAATPAFGHAELTTTFIETHAELLFARPVIPLQEALPIMALLVVLTRRKHFCTTIGSSNIEPNSPWQSRNAWRANMLHHETLPLIVNDEHYDIDVTHNNVNEAAMASENTLTLDVLGRHVTASGAIDRNQLTAIINGKRKIYHFSKNHFQFGLFSNAFECHFEMRAADFGNDGEDTSATHLSAPMNGTVITHLVEADTRISKGTPLLIMEAMKMEHTIKAPSGGTVKGYFYQPGELVNGGAILIDFENDVEH